MSRHRRLTARLWLLLAMVVATGAVADPPVADKAGAGAEPEARLKLLDNKLRLLDTLLHRGEAAQRIDQGAATEAKTLLGTARAAFDKARRLRLANALDECEAELGRGLQAFTSATRLAGDPERQRRLVREHYGELTRRVAGFREAFVRIVAERPVEARLLDLNDVDKLVQRAGNKAARNDYEAANVDAIQAADLLERALTRARHQQTLVYEIKFNSPAEEYAYETERNRGHEALIRLLLGERSLAEAERRSVLAVLEDNALLRARAEALAARGDNAAAIRRLEQATEILTQALRQLGAPVE